MAAGKAFIRPTFLPVSSAIGLASNVQILYPAAFISVKQLLSHRGVGRFYRKNNEHRIVFKFRIHIVLARPGTLPRRVGSPLATPLPKASKI